MSRGFLPNAMDENDCQLVSCYKNVLFYFLKGHVLLEIFLAVRIWRAVSSRAKLAHSFL